MSGWLARAKELSGTSQNIYDKVDTPATTSTLSQRSGHVSKRRTYGDELKIIKLRRLIAEVDSLYGSSEPEFLAAVIDDIVSEWQDRLDEAIACFAALANERPYIGKLK